VVKQNVNHDVQIGEVVKQNESHDLHVGEVDEAVKN